MESDKPPSITQGMPEARNDWPSEVLQSIALFTAGHIVSRPPLFYYAEPKHAIWAATARYSDTSEGPEIINAISVRPEYGIITTQTCDLVEEDADPPCKPWIQVAPVYDMQDILNSGERRLLKKGRGSLHLAHIPSLGSGDQFWVADFRIEVPIEKSWLAGQAPIAGFPDETSQRRALDKLVAIRSRPAWSAIIVDNVQRVIFEAIKLLKSTDEVLYEKVMQVDEIGARTDSLLSPSTVQLAIFSDGQPPEEVLTWWGDLTDKISETLASRSITMQQPAILDYKTCSVAEYRKYSPIPLLKYSPV